MKKYFIIEECYKKEKSDVFKRYYTRDTLYNDEIFDTLKEVREFCKKNNVTTYDISEDHKTLDYYWIEEREVDEDNEIISDNYEGYPITDNEENDTLIYDGNTDLYEVTADIFGYDNRFKVAEKLFFKAFENGNLDIRYFDIVISSDTLYNDNEVIVKTDNAKEIIKHLKELDEYDSIIDRYMDGLKEVVFKM